MHITKGLKGLVNYRTTVQFTQKIKQSQSFFYFSNGYLPAGTGNPFITN
jgi:hypothetical protein